MAGDPRGPLYFFQHTSKAAGTSFLLDAPDAPISLNKCSTATYCYDPTLKPAQLKLMATQWAKGGCNLVACEGYQLQNRRVVSEALAAADEAPPSEERLLMLVREPETHVKSMYAMCQQDSAASSGQFEDITFDRCARRGTPCRARPFFLVQC